MEKTKIYLIVLLALMIASLGAMAQPGGLNPLVGSTHSYSVTSGGGGLSWTISPGTAAIDYVINSGATATNVSITWKTAGTYSLTLTETNGTLCKTIKQVSVKVDPNTFNVHTTSPVATCNVAEDVINPPTSYTNHVTINVDMTTGTSWSPTWEFIFGLTGTNGTISNVKVGGTSQAGISPYTITGITSTSGSKTVAVECDITGDPTLFQSVVLTINSARELTYNTPSNATGSQSATQTINAIPATSSISAN